jgi:hypothetical protein
MPVSEIVDWLAFAGIVSLQALCAMARIVAHSNPGLSADADFA